MKQRSVSTPRDACGQPPTISRELRDYLFNIHNETTNLHAKHF
jgi:hypothetical protein